MRRRSDVGMLIGLLYLHACEAGGYPRDVRWLARSLAKAGATVSLICQPGTQRDGLSDDVRLITPEEAVHEPRFDVLHIWGAFVPTQMRRTARIERDATVLSPVGQLMSAHLQVKWWKKLPYLLFIRFVSRKGNLAVHVFSPAENNGIVRLLNPRLVFEAQAGLFPPGQMSSKSDSLYLLFFGRNDVHQKGLDYLLDGYARAVRDGLRTRLKIAGRSHGNSADYLLSMVGKLQLHEQVDLIGELEETAEATALIGNARALIFLSRWDGPPRPVREALALGTPVIVSPGTNMAQVVSSTGAGASTPLDAKSISERLLLSEDELTWKHWKASVSKAQRLLDWDEVAQSFLDGYRATLNMKGGRGQRELSERDQACPLCERVGQAKTIRRSPDYQLWMCEHCGFIWKSIKKSLSSIYEDIYDKGEYLPCHLRSRETSLGPERQYLTFLIPHQGRGKSILEIGPGAGYSLDYFSRKGFSVEGIDISPRLANSIYERFGHRVHVGPVESHQNSETYDFVIATHVIEHVPDPRSFIRSVHRLLKPKGCLVLATPNVKAGMGRLLRSLYWIYEVEDHVSFFTPSTLSALLISEGFEPDLTFTHGVDVAHSASQIVRRLRPLSSGHRVKAVERSQSVSRGPVAVKDRIRRGIDKPFSRMARKGLGYEIVVTARKP